MPRTALLAPPAQTTEAGGAPTAAARSEAQATAATHLVFRSWFPWPSSGAGRRPPSSAAPRPAAFGLVLLPGDSLLSAKMVAA